MLKVTSESENETFLITRICEFTGFTVHRFSIIGPLLSSWGHVTSTLYKPNTSLRRTAETGPDGVRLRKKLTVKLTSVRHRVKICKKKMKNRLT